MVNFKLLVPQLTDANLLDMTFVSNDPSWWPVIDMNRYNNYFIGSWRSNGTTLMMSHSIFYVVSQSHPAS
jgi:hypothetical protein